ncbi:outer membrane beta-barrel protein [Vibrio parahaemolyticus]|nr:porin family protein [Vibrio parahaemolyticus]
MKKLVFASVISALSLNAFAATQENEFNAPVKYNYADLGYNYATGDLDNKYGGGDTSANAGHLTVSMLPFKYLGFTGGIGYAGTSTEIMGITAKPNAMTISAEVMPRLPITESIDAFAAFGGSYASITSDDPSPETGLKSSDDDFLFTYRAGINAALWDNAELTLQAGGNSENSNPFFYSAAINYYVSDSVAVGFNIGSVSSDYFDSYTTYGLNVRFAQNSFKG